MREREREMEKYERRKIEKCEKEREGKSLEIEAVPLSDPSPKSTLCMGPCEPHALHRFRANATFLPCNQTPRQCALYFHSRDFS